MCNHVKEYEALVEVDEWSQNNGYDGEFETEAEKLEFEEFYTPYQITAVLRCSECGDEFGDDSIGGVWSNGMDSAINDAIFDMSIEGVSLRDVDVNVIYD